MKTIRMRFTDTADACGKRARLVGDRATFVSPQSKVWPKDRDADAGAIDWAAPLMSFPSTHRARVADDGTIEIFGPRKKASSADAKLTLASQLRALNEKNKKLWERKQ